jgi:hypothetical protein
MARWRRWGPRAVDGVGVPAPGARGEEGRVEHGEAGPAVAVAARGEGDGEVVAGDLAHAREPDGEVVAVGAELQLKVLAVGGDEEELDDLALPEGGAASGREGRGRVAVEGGVDLDGEGVWGEVEGEGGALVVVERGAVPGVGDVERGAHQRSWRYLL